MPGMSSEVPGFRYAMVFEPMPRSTSVARAGNSAGVPMSFVAPKKPSSSSVFASAPVGPPTTPRAVISIAAFASFDFRL